MVQINKTQQAYAIIKEKILTLELAPMQVLKEVELCEMLELSRTPIREAMQKLIAEGFIIEKSPKLNLVAPLTVNQFVDIYQLREVLEVLCVKLATLNWSSEEDINYLIELTADQKLLSKQHDVNSVEFLKVDRQFHRKLYEMSCNQFLEQELLRISELYYRYNYFTMFKNRSYVTVLEHEDIIEAIKSRNSRNAEIYMKDHLSTIRESILIGLSKTSENMIP